MSTVLRIDGLSVIIYPHGHRPAHVHVWGGGGEAVFFLNCPDGPPELRENRGFDRRHLGRVVDGLRPHLMDLCERWRGIHGDY
ncbi:MAG: DUF4160 domain-containing protein [Pseudomonadota bacterium]